MPWYQPVVCMFLTTMSESSASPPAERGTLGCARHRRSVNTAQASARPALVAAPASSGRSHAGRLARDLRRVDAPATVRADPFCALSLPAEAGRITAV